MITTTLAPLLDRLRSALAADGANALHAEAIRELDSQRREIEDLHQVVIRVRESSQNNFDRAEKLQEYFEAAEAYHNGLATSDERTNDLRLARLQEARRVLGVAS